MLNESGKYLTGETKFSGLLGMSQRPIMMRDSQVCAQSQPQRIANVFVSHFSNELGPCGRLKMTSNSLTFFFFQEVGFISPPLDNFD